MTRLHELQARIKEFNAERQWGEFHTPKNLALAVCSEAGELADIMRWLTESESDNLSPEQLESVKNEVSDIFIFLLTMSERLGIDLVAATESKLKLNEERYPVASSRGNADKYK